MNENEKTVWNFYVNILEKHADELTMKEVDVKLDGQKPEVEDRKEEDILWDYSVKKEKNHRQKNSRK